MPISSRGSFDNTGNAYDVSRILNDDTTINIEAYHNYSPLFLSSVQYSYSSPPHLSCLPLSVYSHAYSTTFAISYGLSFASITATLMHTFLYYRKQIWSQSRRAMHEQADIHARLMSQYKQVPEWWYGIIFRTFLVPPFITHTLITRSLPRA
jgi:hypothetical protein